MKTIAEAEQRLHHELWQWVSKQAQNMLADYYLYYQEATPSHDGGLLICKEPPANKDFRLAWPQRIDKTATVEQNFNRLRLDCLRRLPILSY